MMLPSIKRSRGYKLYSSDGKRYLDFYQEGGKAILGSRPAGFSLALKNEIEKGNYYGFPSSYEKKAFNLLKQLAGSEAPPFKAFFFSTEQEAHAFVQTIADVAITLWHPFEVASLGKFLQDYGFVMPIIPFPGSFAPVAVLVSEVEAIDSVTKSNPISPILLAGFCRATALLVTHIKANPYKIWEKHIKELAPLWCVKLPYLTPAYKKEQHSFVFKSFFDKQIIIQRDFNELSALPPCGSEGISFGEKKIFLETANTVIRWLSL